METSDIRSLVHSLLRLRGDAALPPTASVIIPVNAQNDLQNVLRVIRDISTYHGRHSVEIILIINNYSPDSPPDEIEQYQTLGLRVLAFPKIEERGEIYLTIRALGARSALSEYTIHFDADCRIPDATRLIDWYIQQFNLGAKLAYTYVGYYDLPTGPAMKLWMGLYKTFRWFKRVALRIPVSRGSNYAVIRSVLLEMYDKDLLNYDIKVGATIRSIGGKIAYSGEKSLVVLTSGRNFRGDWKELFDYMVWRISYYHHLSPLKPESVKQDPGR